MKTSFPSTNRGQRLTVGSEIGANGYGVMLSPARFSDTEQTGKSLDVEAYLDGNTSRVVLLKLGLLYRGYFERLTVGAIADGSPDTVVDVTLLHDPAQDIQRVGSTLAGAWARINAVVIPHGAGPVQVDASPRVVATRERVLLLSDAGNGSVVKVSFEPTIPAGSFIPLPALASIGAIPLGPGVAIYAKNDSGADETIYLLQV